MGPGLIGMGALRDGGLTVVQVWVAMSCRSCSSLKQLPLGVGCAVMHQTVMTQDAVVGGPDESLSALVAGCA